MLKIKKIKHGLLLLLLQGGLLACSIDSRKTGSLLRDRCAKRKIVIPTIVIESDKDVSEIFDELKYEVSSENISFSSPKTSLDAQRDLYHFENDCMPIAIGCFLLAGSLLLCPEVQKFIWEERK